MILVVNFWNQIKYKPLARSRERSFLLSLLVFNVCGVLHHVYTVPAEAGEPPWSTVPAGGQLCIRTKPGSSAGAVSALIAEPSRVPFLSLFKIIFCIWELWLHVCLCHAHTEPTEEGVGSIGTGVIDNCEPPRRCWECEGLPFIGLKQEDPP